MSSLVILGASFLI